MAVRSAMLLLGLALIARAAGAQEDTLPPEPGAPPEPAPVIPPAPETAPPPPPIPAPPPPTEVAPPPPLGPWRLSGSIGIGASFVGTTSQTYVVIAAGIGYELVGGLEANFGAAFWAGSPAVAKIAPGLTWYAPIPLTPYVGVYYAHWFISDDIPPENAIGFRFGLIQGDGPVVLGVGLAFERTLHCSSGCDAIWPDVSAGVRF